MLAIRGISDLVGFKRDAKWTAFACESAAAFTYSLLKTGQITKSVSEDQANNQRQYFRSYFDHLIEDRCRLFAGRSQDVKKLLTFLEVAECGYFFVEGPSGFGKTALLANIVRAKPAIAYHFISQSYKTHASGFDPTELDSMLLNLLEQLEANRPDDRSLPPRTRFQRFLRSSPVKGSRIIVIDGVDEVGQHPNYLYGLLPQKLAAGVFVILSARRLGDQNYLSEIGLKDSDIADRVELKGLDYAGIVELLKEAGPRSAGMLQDPNCILRLETISGGDPFYLRFLVEDIAGGVITTANLNTAPSGLYSYFDMQFSILARSAHTAQHRDIIGTILAAHGPLSQDDLIRLVPGLDWLNFDNIIRDIRRFLLIFNKNYTFCHPRFKEYFQAKSGGSQVRV